MHRPGAQPLAPFGRAHAGPKKNLVKRFPFPGMVKRTASVKYKKI